MTQNFKNMVDRMIKFSEQYRGRKEVEEKTALFAKTYFKLNRERTDPQNFFETYKQKYVR